MPTSPPPASIRELAALLNLSKGSVSRILNHKGEAFSESTRRRVFAMAEQIGYRPHPVARALATGHTGFVALWIRDLITPYHALVAHTMEDQLERHGYEIVVGLHGNTETRRARAAMGGVDGVIAHEDYWIAASGRVDQRVPVISTGVSYDRSNRDFVGIDLESAAAEAVRHLIEPGRRRVAYLMHDIETRTGDPRLLAYQAVMHEAGLPIEYIDPPSEDRATVRIAVREYIDRNGCPEALLCHSDDVAIATYRALCDLGIRVGDDVALFGCDGIDDTAYFPVPISTIAQPLATMCETAWRFLRRRLAEPDAPPQQVVLQPKLLLRESSAPR